MPSFKDELPPRLCKISDHAARRYQERFGHVPNVEAKAILNQALNSAKLCGLKQRRKLGANGIGLEKRRRSLWISGNIVLVTEYTGRKLIVVTCFPRSWEAADAAKPPRQWKW